MTSGPPSSVDAAVTRPLIRQSGAMVWALRDQSKLVLEHVNVSAEALFGQALVPYVGAPMAHITPGPWRGWAADVQRVAQGLSTGVQWTWWSAATKSAQRAEVVPLGPDRALMTVRSLAELEAAQRDQQRAQDQLAQFIRSTSHDLREPLRSVSGFAQIVLHKASALLDDPAWAGSVELHAICEFAKKCNDASTRLNQRLRALREVSQAAVFDPNGPFDLEDVLGRVMLDLDALLKSRGAKVTILRPLPPVAGDSEHVALVLQNLITNAVLYSDGQPAIEVGGTAGSEWSLVWVKDAGIGVLPEHLGKIFNVFKRLDKRRGDGQGIGLTIAQQVVARHGGRIWAESKGAGRGTTIKFTLPCPHAVL